MPGEIIASDQFPALDASARLRTVSIGHTNDGWLAISVPPGEVGYIAPADAVALITAARQHLSARGIEAS